MVENAAILNTGDELTTGRVVDTNGAYLADHLLDIGVSVSTVLIVGDRQEDLLRALGQSLEAADFVIMTGGLGPTADDLTREVVSEFLSRPLLRNKEEEKRLEALFRSRNRTMTSNNFKQADFPAGSEVIPNPLGSAPGFWVSFDYRGRPKHLAALPGVPREMEQMAEATVFPKVKQLMPGRPVLVQTFKLVGVTESELDAIVSESVVQGSLKVSFRAHFPDLTLKLRVEGQEKRPVLEDASGRIRERLKQRVYAERDVDLETVVALQLMDLRATLAVAESLTGGMVSERLTRIPGSSCFFKLGIVVYSEEAKQTEIGVRNETLTNEGAVSQKTAEEMAEGVRRKCNADFGLGITGIAGPTGGTEATPKGTVWIGLATRNSVESTHMLFPGERQMVRLLASQMALNRLRLKIQEYC